MTYLSGILENKHREIEEAKRKLSLKELKAKVATLPKRKNFKEAISRLHHINLVAEIKKSSPSRGVLRKDFEPVKIAQIYKAQRAAALSVLTDEKYFGGKLEFINEVRAKTDLPILRKDFTIDEYQIYEAALAGADAVLLIADILSLDEIKRFKEIAHSLELVSVVEIHSEEDFRKALECGAEVIGINNRNLHTFKIDLNVTTQFMERMPKGKVVISESGISTHEDVMYMKSLGVNAVLIGEAFMSAEDIGDAVRKIMGFA